MGPTGSPSELSQIRAKGVCIRIPTLVSHGPMTTLPWEAKPWVDQFLLDCLHTVLSEEHRCEQPTADTFHACEKDGLT